MAEIHPDQPSGDAEDPGTPRRSKAVRYGIPLGIVGLAAATIGLVPALAQGGDPDLDEISAKDLIAKVLDSDVEALSGTVKVNTDLGLPAIPMGGGDGSSADPSGKVTQLLSGESTLRVAADGPDRQQLVLVGEDGDYTATHNGKDLWGYDESSNEVYHAEKQQKDADAGKDGGAFGLPEDLEDATPQELAERALEAADGTTDVSVDGTAKVAGQDAYELRLAPKEQESTVQDIRIAVDADNGVPLKVTLTADDGVRAFDAGFTSVDFAKPDKDAFDFTPPEGAKVTEKNLDELGGADGGKRMPQSLEGVEILHDGWASVAEVELPDGVPGGSGKGGAALDMFTEKTAEGRVFSSRLINVLITDDGKVYAGAVTPDALAERANG